MQKDDQSTRSQLSLKNRPMLVHADVRISLTQNAAKHGFPCCAVKCCLLVNDCNLLAAFSDFYPTDALNDGDPFELSGSYSVWEN